MPEYIWRKFKGKKAQYVVYSSEEADELGLSSVPWREAQEGQWAESDDGYVAKVVRRLGPYVEGKGRERCEVTLPYARRWTTNKPLIFEEWRKTKKWGGGRPDQNWVEKELSRPIAKEVMHLYCKLYIEHGGKIPEEKMKRLGVMLRPKGQRIPEANLKRLIRQKETQAVIKEELERILSDKGITPDKVIQDYESVKQQALALGQTSTAKSIVDKYAEMLDMKPDKREQVTEIEIDWQDVLEEADDEEPLQIEESKKRLKGGS